MKATDVKRILENILCEVVAAPAPYVYEPQKNFSRTRKLPLYTVIKMLIGMGRNSLGKELLDWFGYSEKTVSVSAFVQQRNKIKPDALKHIFQTMVSQCDKHTLYNGYRLLAIDGSAISDKVILIADRGYESFNNITHCQEKNWNYIIRSKESYGIKFEAPPSATFDIDQLITLARRQTKQTKNLPREDFPVDVLKELYRLRWGIETAFRELKYNVGLASIHGKKIL